MAGEYYYHNDFNIITIRFGAVNIDLILVGWLDHPIMTDHLVP